MRRRRSLRLALLRYFDWNDIGSEILASLGETIDPMSMGMGAMYMYTGIRESNNSSSGIKMALQIADGLNAGAAQVALLNAAVGKAAILCDEVLCASNTLDLLWKWAV
ncbi:hypothetical protein GN244_ATG07975 [Phytophthora infestans]|uniref:Uncharacterized protein n=1 Tax=Phytophthora infestans TaxID=4787 RepID=A0A833TF66_PHYIN|nr:hypothetical protein GN244_ATG07975 [Phytophthora infestans]